jgi:hypothetical protein
MQTFDFQKTPVVPPHCLWVSGLLLESGSRADAGLPLLRRMRHPAGNRLAMGDKAPGAWGAPGADPFQELAAGLASLWAGGTGEAAKTSQMNRGHVSLHAPEFLLSGAVSRRSDPLAVSPPEAAAAALKISDDIVVSSGEASPAVGRVADDAGEEVSPKRKVSFAPKPEPWSGSSAPCGKMLMSGPPSFCRRIVTFTPAPNPVR